MTLSMVVITRNSGAWIRRLMQVGRAIADEVVVGIDDSSTDNTESQCRGFADRIVRLEPLEYNIEQAFAALNDCCSSDWILRLDDDELPSARLVAALPALMRDREMTHYWFRRRWVIGNTATQWIAGSPYWPDWQLRLYRNIRSIVTVPGELHTSYIVQGWGRYWSDGALYHFERVWRSDRDRRRKIQAYRRLRPAFDHAGFYEELGRGYAELAPSPLDDPPWKPSLPEMLWSRMRALAVAQTTELPHISLIQMRRARFDGTAWDANIFQGAVVQASLPPVMEPGGMVAVDVELTNTGPSTWVPLGSGTPAVRLAYHWFNVDDTVFEFEGVRADLPHALRSGECTHLTASIRAPEQNGEFILRWDLVVEGEAWFSERGWIGPASIVQIATAECSLQSPENRLNSAAQHHVEHEPVVLRLEAPIPEFC